MLISLLPLAPARCLVVCLLVATFEFLAYAASDLVMPAMLDVVNDLNAGAEHVPLSLILYMVGGIALQWLLGPLSDNIGRRPMFIAGNVLFAAACFSSALSQDIFLFNVLRIVQGLSLGFVVAVGYPALQEMFSEKQALRVTALLANIALLSPLLAPLGGALLLDWFSWRDIFLLLGTCATLVTIGLFYYMPETIGVLRTDGTRVPRQALGLRAILRGYGDALRHRRFMSGCFAIGLIAIPLISWMALSPLLLIRNLGMSPSAYGLMQLPIFGAVIVGNLLLGHLAVRRTLPQLLRLGTVPLLAGALISLGASLPAAQTAAPGLQVTIALLALIAGLMIYAVGLGIANTTLYRMTLLATNAGTGACAALMGSITVSLFAGGGMIATRANAAASPGTFGFMLAMFVALAMLPLFFLRNPESIPTSPAALSVE